MTIEDWNRVVGTFHAASRQDLWRGYMRQVYDRLGRRWFEGAPAGPRLKTDLFEEAISSHHPMSGFPPGSVGTDGSIAVAVLAKQQLGSPPGHHLVVSDLRHSPFREASLGSILSGSSLDHFSREEDLVGSVAEVAAALAPGGVLILTLDNPTNPVVWLRNHLPERLLRRLRLVPYFVGRTWGRRRTRRELARLGLEVHDETAIAHIPRAPAMWLDSLTGRWRGGRVGRILSRLYLGFERLENLPTRYLTGYYIAVRARKPTGG